MSTFPCWPSFRGGFKADWMHRGSKGLQSSDRLCSFFRQGDAVRHANEGATFSWLRIRRQQLPQSEAQLATDPALRNGIARIRLPVARKIAFATAGPTTPTPTSPVPP